MAQHLESRHRTSDDLPNNRFTVSTTHRGCLLPQHAHRVAGAACWPNPACGDVAGGCSTRTSWRPGRPPSNRPGPHSPRRRRTAAGQGAPLAGSPQSAAVDPPPDRWWQVVPGTGATLTLVGRAGPDGVVALPGPADGGRRRRARFGLCCHPRRVSHRRPGSRDGDDDRRPRPGTPTSPRSPGVRTADYVRQPGIGDHPGRGTKRGPGAADVFARVDAIVAQGDIRRGPGFQTSVTELNPTAPPRPGAAGRPGCDHDRRRCAGPGAGGRHPRRTTAGVRHRSADRAAGLPGRRLALRIAGRKTWCGFRRLRPIRWWLRSGYRHPVEKVRYPTVQQPNALAFDDTTDTLYVVSGLARVQMISTRAALSVSRGHRGRMPAAWEAGLSDDQRVDSVAPAAGRSHPVTASTRLSIEAEYRGWELTKVRLYTDGSRRVLLRRRDRPADGSARTVIPTRRRLLFRRRRNASTLVFGALRAATEAGRRPGRALGPVIRFWPARVRVPVSRPDGTCRRFSTRTARTVPHLGRSASATRRSDRHRPTGSARQPEAEALPGCRRPWSAQPDGLQQCRRRATGAASGAEHSDVPIGVNIGKSKVTRPRAWSRTTGQCPADRSAWRTIWGQRRSPNTPACGTCRRSRRCARSWLGCSRRRRPPRCCQDASTQPR